MSVSNRWEPLHRASSLLTVLGAIFGGAAVTAVINAIVDALTQPHLPWWGELGIAAVLSLVTLIILRRLQSTITAANDARPTEVPSGSTQNQINVGVTRPESSPRIAGAFCNLRIIRYGLISEARNNGQQWVLCGIRLNVSLSIMSGPDSLEIKEIRLQTYKNKPPRRSHKPMAPQQASVLKKEHGTLNFEAYPQIEYQYEGQRDIPTSLEMVVTDEFGYEHLIHLRNDEQLPTLPGDVR